LICLQELFTIKNKLKKFNFIKLKKKKDEKE